MHRTPAGSISRTSIRTRSVRPAGSARSRRSAHQRLARTNRTRVNRPTRHRTRRPGGRHSRPRRRWSAGHRRSSQACDHVRPGWHNRTRSRLPGKIRFRRRTQRSAPAGDRCWSRCGWCARPHCGSRRRNTGNHCGRWTRNPRNRPRNRHRWRRLRHVTQTCGHRLARTGKDLPGFRSWNRTRRNRRAACRSWGRNPRRTNGSAGSRMRRSHVWRVPSRTRQRRTQRMHRPRRRSNRFLGRFPGRFGYRRSSFRSGGRLRANCLNYRRCTFDFGRRQPRLFFNSGRDPSSASPTQAAANLRHDVIVERARVRLLVHDA
jgi:hypothetical protein